MNKPLVAIVSPHRDDAAFSCGILMRALLRTVDIEIVNVFTWSAYAPFNTRIEQGGAGEVSELRRKEDVAMRAALLGFLAARTGDHGSLSEVGLGLPDAPLRLELPLERIQGETLDDEKFEDEVLALTRILLPVLENKSYVMMPLGLGGAGLEGHIDHRIVRDAGLRCMPMERIAFYEDLPYAARMMHRHRSEGISAFAPVGRQGLQPYTVRDPDGVPLKRLLAGQYSSQVDSETVEEMCTYAEERGGGEVVYAGAAFRALLDAALLHRGRAEGATGWAQ